MKTQVESLQKQLKDAQSILDSFSNDRRDLTSQLMEQQQTIQKLSQQNQLITHQMISLKTDHLNLQVDYKHLNSSINELEDEVLNLTQQNQQLVVDVQAGKDDVQKLEHQLLDTTEALSDLKLLNHRISNDKKLLAYTWCGGVVVFVIFCIGASYKFKKWHNSSVENVRIFFKRNIEILQRSKVRRFKNDVTRLNIQQQEKNRRLEPHEIEKFLKEMEAQQGEELGANKGMISDAELESRLREHFNYKLN